MFDNDFVKTILILTVLDVLVKIVRATSFAYGNLVQAAKIFKAQIIRVIYGQASFFDIEESGQILTRLSSDQNVIDTGFPFEVNMLCNNVVNFFGTFVVMIAM